MVDGLAAAFVGHMVGDFLLQNDWMASKKKQSAMVCMIHVWIYTFCVLSFTGWWDKHEYAWLMVFLPHYLIDHSGFVRWWMNAFGQRVFAEPPMGPWSVISVDQAWHFVCLYFAALYISAGYA